MAAVVVIAVAGVAVGAGVDVGAVVADPVRVAVVAFVVCTACALHTCRDIYFQGSTHLLRHAVAPLHFLKIATLLLFGH